MSSFVFLIFNFSSLSDFRVYIVQYFVWFRSFSDIGNPMIFGGCFDHLQRRRPTKITAWRVSVTRDFGKGRVLKSWILLAHKSGTISLSCLEFCNWVIDASKINPTKELWLFIHFKPLFPQIGDNLGPKSSNSHNQILQQQKTLSNPKSSPSILQFL